MILCIAIAMNIYCNITFNSSFRLRIYGGKNIDNANLFLKWILNKMYQRINIVDTVCHALMSLSLHRKMMSILRYFLLLLSNFGGSFLVNINQKP